VVEQEKTKIKEVIEEKVKMEVDTTAGGM